MSKQLLLAGASRRRPSVSPGPPSVRLLTAATYALDTNVKYPTTQAAPRAQEGHGRQDGAEDWSDPPSTAGRPSDTSSLLGQVFTPQPIARMMARDLLRGRPMVETRILDPCIGPGTFVEAMVEERLISGRDEIACFDIDDAMIKESLQRLSPASGNSIHIRNADYLMVDLEPVSYAILNPPYVRQEWIDQKAEYRSRIGDLIKRDLPGTSNLYVYFIAKVVADLVPGGKFSCLVYDSWQYTRYGRWLKELLAEECHDLRVVSAGPQPFSGRMIDATIITGTRRSQPSRAKSTRVLRSNPTEGLQRIDDLFFTRRGLRLKQASFFLCQGCSDPDCPCIPFLKKVGSVKGYAVPRDHPDAAIIVTARGENPHAEEILERRLWMARESEARNATILNWAVHRPDTWMFHRNPPQAPIVFNYYLRNRPRHIFNPDRPYSDNFYGLVPRSGNVFGWVALLNSDLVVQAILDRSRNQGVGLSKIQLYEYRDVLVPDIAVLDDCDTETLIECGRDLVSKPERSSGTIRKINSVILASFGSTGRWSAA